MQQLTADYILSQNAWDDIATKLYQIAEENRLIKQAVHKIYNTSTGMLGKGKNKNMVPILMIEVTTRNRLILVQKVNTF